MKILVIAEKPKLAGNCVAGLSLLGETLSHKNGYYEGDNYIVTYCFGHLLGLNEIADYTGEKSWQSVSLPFVPESFEFKVKDEAAEQYETIESLIHRSDIKEVYHLGDADREGEVIVRNVLHRASNTHPVMRIWTDDQTETALADAIRKVRPDKEYDNLYNEGLARTYLDWMYGINLTRYITLRTQARPPLRVGRVLIPIIKKIYDREMEIRNFVSVPYLQAEGNGIKDKIEYKLVLTNAVPRMRDSEVETLVNQLKQMPAIVKTVKKKETIVSRPKLFNLGKAQARIANLHKIGMTESMGCIQALYESGYLTYPRTDSEYLADTEIDKVDEVIRSIKKNNPDVHITQREKGVYDNGRVVGHSALRPTYKIPDDKVFEELVKEAKQKAGGKVTITADIVKKCYATIYNRFLAAFASDECRRAETEVMISVGDHEFILNGQATIQAGFLEYDNTIKRDKEIPAFTEGEELSIKWIAAKKKTIPPKRLTVEALNNYLINPFKSEIDDDYKAVVDGLSIGTQSTRTPIIQNAIDSQYIACRENSYYLLDRGEYLINTMDTLDIDLYRDRTVEFNKLLISVNKGEMEIEEVVNRSKTDLVNIIQNADQITEIKVCQNSEATTETEFQCPFCNAKIYKGKYGYYCKNKDFSYSKIRGVEVTDSMMQAFMKKKKILIKGMISEKGSYDAYVIPQGWEHQDKYTNLKHTLEFLKKKRRSGK